MSRPWVRELPLFSRESQRWTEADISAIWRRIRLSSNWLSYVSIIQTNCRFSEKYILHSVVNVFVILMKNNLAKLAEFILNVCYTSLRFIFWLLNKYINIKNYANYFQNNRKSKFDIIILIVVLMTLHILCQTAVDYFNIILIYSRTSI